jgi:hypothetical protein
VGGSLVGWIAQELGARWSLIVGGLPTLLCGLLAFPVMARIDRRNAGQMRVARDEIPPGRPS